MRLRYRAASSLPIALAALLGQFQAAGAPATAQRVDSRAVVAEVRRIISERYVLPERRPVLDAALARAVFTGRYDVADPAALATLINEDLARVGRDGHLNFNYNPEQARIYAAAQNRNGARCVGL
jgi:hypothetical protein